jgi:predicted lipoprotein with Yx(FWY)xxD motif
MVALSACGNGSSGYGAAAPAAHGTSSSATGAVTMKNVAGLGPTLVDSSGQTLYTAEQEANSTVRCTAACLGFWTPVAAPGDSKPAGSVPGLGTVHRPDTQQNQLTYQGKPLYSFRLDHGQGQHTGDQVHDTFGGTHFSWHAATTGAARPSPATTSAPSGGEYGGY